MNMQKEIEEIRRKVRPPDVYCRTCGEKMIKAAPEIYEEGFDIDSGVLKWEFSQRYICPQAKTAKTRCRFWQRIEHPPIHKVTNYLNSDRWFTYKRMDDMNCPD
ncbi:unnamed protein product [marine sediment metagenome]|uniref:Uncharacterized protein n=1 Tax=marine sediment metagenome TaxID=412755 RepID=X0WAM6_9ZZZZ